MKGAAAGKGDLRKMMRSALAQKKQEKKITSPLVRYNAVGQPVCRVCEVTVKDEALWDAHVASKQHKLAILELKKQKDAKSGATTTTPVATPAGFKRPIQPPAAAAAPSGFKAPLAPVAAPPAAAQQSKGKEKAKEKSAPSLLLGYGDEEEDEEEEEGAHAPPPSPAASAKRKAHEVTPSSSSSSSSSSTSSSALPAGFFDAAATATEAADVPSPSKKLKAAEAPVAKKGAIPADFFDAAAASSAPAAGQVVIEAQAKPSGDAESKGALPTGFFDDPNKDSQMRPKAAAQKPSLEDEWEKFQATMTQVAEDEEKKKRESENLAQLEDLIGGEEEEAEENEEDEEISLEFQRKEERLSQLQELRQRKLAMLRQKMGAQPAGASTDVSSSDERTTMDIEPSKPKEEEDKDDEEEEEEDDEEEDDDEDEYDWRAKLL